MTNRIAKEARNKMDYLIIHEKPPRDLLDNDTYCATYPLFDGN